MSAETLIYNGKPLSDFGVWFDSSMSFASPEADYDLIDVLGRNGSLSIFNNRYKDVDISFPCFIRENFVQNFRDLTEFLLSGHGYLRLETTKEPNQYRKALFLRSVEPTPTQFTKGGRFTLVFRCHPQRWLKLGEHWINFASNGVVMNPTLQAAKPIIRIVGTGSVTVGSQTITVNTAGTNYIDFDCDLMDAYEGAFNRNANVSVTGQVQLNSGTNGITLDGVTISLLPRWFEI